MSILKIVLDDLSRNPKAPASPDCQTQALKEAELARDWSITAMKLREIFNASSVFG